MSSPQSRSDESIEDVYLQILTRPDLSILDNDETYYPPGIIAVADLPATNATNANTTTTTNFNNSNNTSNTSNTSTNRLDALAQHRISMLRKLIATKGLPDSANQMCTPKFGECSLRGIIWKVFLGIGEIQVDKYIEYINKGPSSDAEKINIDTLRTFSKNEDFTSRVSQNKLNRVLNAYCHYRGNAKGVYVQSMSILCAPFVYLMPEPDAFQSMCTFLSCHIPQYINKYAGVITGCRLLEDCLKCADEALYKHLENYRLKPEVYAFSAISTLNACVPPLSDTVKLWDIQLAFGAYWGIVFTLARLVNSSEILRSPRGPGAPLITRELEQGLGMSADAVLRSSFVLIRLFDRDLCQRLMYHPLKALT